MAFNSLTSPATFANQQAKWNSLTNGVSQGQTSNPVAQKIMDSMNFSTGSSSSTPSTSQPTQSSGTTSSGGSTYYSAAAAAAAKAAAQAKTDYDSAKNTTYSSINDAIGDAGRGLNTSVLDYLDTLSTGQKAIDKAAVQNELAKQQGRLGVLDMVGQGIRSGGVMLNNKGATNSSAAEALTQAYNTLGQKQLSGVGNQYEAGKSDIQDQQDALALQSKQFLRHFEDNKVSAVNTIVQDASSKLAQLNAAAQNANLADRIDIESQKAAIRNQALSALAQYDDALNKGISGTTAASEDTNRAKAAEMLQAGVAPDNAFTYSTIGTPQWAGTGPFASPLAVYASPTTKKQDDTLVSPLGA